VRPETPNIKGRTPTPAFRSSFKPGDFAIAHLQLTAKHHAPQQSCAIASNENFVESAENREKMRAQFLHPRWRNAVVVC